MGILCWGPPLWGHCHEDVALGVPTLGTLPWGRGVGDPVMETLCLGPHDGDVALGTQHWGHSGGGDPATVTRRLAPETPNSRAWLGSMSPSRVPVPGAGKEPISSGRRGWAPITPPGDTGQGSGAVSGVPAPTHLVGQVLVLCEGESGEWGTGAQRSRAGPCPPSDPRPGVTLPLGDPRPLPATPFFR